MDQIDTDGIGTPHTHFHRTRAGAGVIAAVAGGVACVLLAIAAIGSVSPADSPSLWIGATAAAVVWLTGLYWRGDAPDARDREAERERRGF